MNDDDTLRQTPAALTPRLPVLGIAVLFVVGLVCAYIDLSMLFLPWVALLLGVVSAALLQSRWALLVVPVALCVATLLSIISRVRGLPDPTAPGFIAGVVLFLPLAVLPAAIGAAIGVPLRHELER